MKTLILIALSLWMGLAEAKETVATKKAENTPASAPLVGQGNKLLVRLGVSLADIGMTAPNVKLQFLSA